MTAAGNRNRLKNCSQVPSKSRLLFVSRHRTTRRHPSSLRPHSNLPHSRCKASWWFGDQFRCRVRGQTGCERASDSYGSICSGSKSSFFDRLDELNVRIGQALPSEAQSHVQTKHGRGLVVPIPPGHQARLRRRRVNTSPHDSLPLRTLRRGLGPQKKSPGVVTCPGLQVRVFAFSIRNLMRVYVAGNGSHLKTIYCDVFAIGLKARSRLQHWRRASWPER